MGWLSHVNRLPLTIPACQARPKPGQSRQQTPTDITFPPGIIVDNSWPAKIDDDRTWTDNRSSAVMSSWLMQDAAKWSLAGHIFSTDDESTCSLAGQKKMALRDLCLVNRRWSNVISLLPTENGATWSLSRQQKMERRDLCLVNRRRSDVISV